MFARRDATKIVFVMVLGLGREAYQSPPPKLENGEAAQFLREVGS
jgi:hypothetical protein